MENDLDGLECQRCHFMAPQDAMVCPHCGLGAGAGGAGIERLAMRGVGVVQGHWGKQAAGILLRCKDKYLLAHRSEHVMPPHNWSIPGGALKEDDGVLADPFETAKEELSEEMGIEIDNITPDESYQWHDGNFVFHTFVVDVQRQENPSLNWENDDVGWFTREYIEDMGLHPGLRWVFEQMGMDKGEKGQAKISEKVLQVFKDLREALGVKDIALIPEKQLIYLLGSSRALLRALQNSTWVFRKLSKDPHMSQILSWGEMESRIHGVLYDRHVLGRTASDWGVYPIPDPGGPQSPWWSVKAGKWKEPVKVTWTLADGFDTYHLGDPLDPVLLQFPETRKGRPALPPLMLTHGIDLADLGLIERTGGFMIPSLAFSHRVPESYGDVVFLGSARLLPDCLKPSGKPHRLVTVGFTDLWSPTMGDLQWREMAVGHELAGDSDWWNGNVPRDFGGAGIRTITDSLMTTRMKPEEMVGMHAEHAADDQGRKSPIIRSRVEVIRNMTRIVRDSSLVGPYDYKEREPGSDDYPYMEVKVNAIVPVRSMTACLFPIVMGQEIHRILDLVGFEGWRIPVDTPPVVRGSATMKAHDALRRTWARAMTMAVLEWARAPLKAPGVVKPQSLEVVTVSRRKTWTAYLTWTKQYDYEYGGYYDKNRYTNIEALKAGLSQEERGIMEQVRQVLTPDLLDKRWQRWNAMSGKRTAGFCYLASEAMHHLLSNPSDYKPQVVVHEGVEHWYLLGPNGYVDPTEDQFDSKVPYDQGREKPWYTRVLSKQASEIVSRVQAGKS